MILSSVTDMVTKLKQQKKLVNIYILIKIWEACDDCKPSLLVSKLDYIVFKKIFANFDVRKYFFNTVHNILVLFQNKSKLLYHKAKSKT